MKPRSAAVRDQLWFEYVSTSMFVLAALALQYVIDGSREHTGFEFSTMAILAAAWLCRLGPAISAVALASVGEIVLFLDPRYSLEFAAAGDVLQFALFIVLAVLICLVVSRLKRARSCQRHRSARADR